MWSQFGCIVMPVARKATSTVTCCLPSHLSDSRSLMSTGTTPAPEITLAEWDRDVRKSMDDFKVDDSSIVIKVATGKEDTVYKVSNPHCEHDWR